MALKPIVLQGEQKRVLFLSATEAIQIKGVAGSGKTTVALYRAKHLLDTQSNLFQEAKVAIFTYNKTLVKYIYAITPYISGGYQRETDQITPRTKPGLNVTVTNFHKWAYHFLGSNRIDLYGKTISPEGQKIVIERLKATNSTERPNVIAKSTDFFLEEISWMKGKAFTKKEEYLDAKRTGRGTSDRVNQGDKEVIWKIYTGYQEHLKNVGYVDFDDYALLTMNVIDRNPNFKAPFTHLIIDEAQDLSKAQILVLSRIVSQETRSISIIADAAQRIYKSGFTWSEVGLNVKGRTIEFKINYRNTIPIAQVAMSLLSKETDKEDFTEIKEARRGGSKPLVGYFQSWHEQSLYLINEIEKLNKVGQLASTVILHRNHQGIRSLRGLLDSHQLHYQELRNADEIDFDGNTIKLCTLSSIKGLEFDNVFIVDLNDNIIPYPLGFNGENDEFHISTERRLLYTAITRTREKLWLLSSGKPSRYLGEIQIDLLDNISEGNDNLSSSSTDDLPF